jgi:hypothetical protein
MSRYQSIRISPGNKPPVSLKQNITDDDNWICSFCLLTFNYFFKRSRIPNGQSKMDNLEKLAPQGKQDEEKQNTIYVGHHFTKQMKPI